MKSYRFQVYNSITYHLYIVLCVHHPKSSLSVTFYLPYALFFLHPPPCPPVITVLSSMSMSCFLFLLNPFTFLKNLHPRIYLLILEGEERGEEREKHQCDREVSMSCLPYEPQPGAKPAPRYVPWLGLEPTTFAVLDDAPTN